MNRRSLIALGIGAALARFYPVPRIEKRAPWEGMLSDAGYEPVEFTPRVLWARVEHSLPMYRVGDVLWHDGTPCVITDIAHTIDRARGVAIEITARELDRRLLP